MPLLSSLPAVRIFLAKQRDGMGEALAGQVALHVEEVVAQLGDVPVLRFGEVPDQQVDLAAVLGEIGGDFLAQEDARQVGDC